MRLLRRYGWRRGMELWRLQRAWRAERQMAAYQQQHEHEFRIHHGARPSAPGYRRRP